MNTPTREFLRRPDGARRRSARQALAVIPDMAGLTVSPGEMITLDTNAMDNLANSRQGIDSWSPAPSPDELVIQKRGRRRKTIVWSPDVDARKRDSLFSLSSRDRTPVKSPNKSGIILRSTPRKRLLLGDNEQPPSTPDKLKKVSTDSRKTFPVRIDRSGSPERFTGSLANGLHGLSHEQLVKIVMDLVTMHEDGMLPPDEKLRDVVLKKIPVADVQPLRERLSCLRRNVYASLVSSDMDDTAYGRAFVHLDAFQKAVVGQGNALAESQHWTAVMQYVFAAWSITKELPEWENKGLNNASRNCFKALTCFCTLALKSGVFTVANLHMYAKKFEGMVNDCEELQSSLQLVKHALASLEK